MLKSKGTLLGDGGCIRRGDWGGGVDNVGEVGGESMSSFAIQSVISTSVSSASSSAVTASERVEREGVGDCGEEVLREEFRTGRWRERGLSVGGFCAVEVEVEGGR